MQDLHACLPSADVTLPSCWDKLKKLLGICLCNALSNKSHPGIYGYPGPWDQSRTQAGEVMAAAGC